MEKKCFRKNGQVIWITIFIIPIAILIPYWITFFKFENWSLSLCLNDWYLFAGYIGGTIGSISGLISVTLLYITLNNQRTQQFESTFFNLLSTQRDIVKYIKGDIEDNVRVYITYEGIAYINILVNKIRANDNYDLVENNTLSSYFKHLRKILLYIDRTTCNIEKQEFADFVKAQMSENERYLLNNYLTGIEHSTDEKNRNFKELIEKYKLNE